MVTPPPSVIATLPAPADTWSYVIKDGDTLTDIATRFGTEVNT
ncbi:MAG: LysM peptidoglycan-binding domain-containing protein [Anaerolineae bacterium]|nr:LysM peptidoglycan-binding domain-containing protein [Anaerolineae bacterium]